MPSPKASAARSNPHGGESEKVERASLQTLPFCSKRCKTLDLNGWFSEFYAVAGVATQAPDGIDAGGAADASNTITSDEDLDF